MSVRRYSLFNLLGAIIPMFVLLITVPLYLKALGDVRYGVLALVWLVLGYFGFLEMGLGKATANHIARLHDASAKERGDVFWTALVLNTFFGTFAAIILWAVGSFLLTSVLKIPVEFQEEAITALPWMVATLPLALSSSVLNGALEGSNKFLVVNCLQVMSTVVFQVVPLVIAYTYSPSLAVVIPAAVLTRALMNFPFLVACFRYVPLSSKPGFSNDTVKSLLSYGGWVALSGMINPLLETIDRFLIGIVLGAQAVTFYTVPYQLVTKARVLPGSLGRALFPKFSAEKAEDAEMLAQKSLLTLLVIMTPVIVICMLILNPFMIFWVGKDIGQIASPLGEIILFGVWANSLAHIPYFLLQGKGRPDIAAKFHALELVPFIIFLWVALHFWGLYGAALAWSIRAVIDSCLLFHFSGIPKGVMRLMGTPIVIVICTLVATHFVSGKPCSFRLFLTSFCVLGILGWLKKSYRNGLLADIFPYKTYPVREDL